MRSACWKTRLLFSFLSLAGGAVAADAAVLADPNDIVVLDESPAVPDTSIAAEEAVQSAFPVFYGTLPVTAANPAPTPEPEMPAAPALPVPELPGQGLTLGEPVPLPPPAELLAGTGNEGASALPAARAAADPVPSIGTPLPPPLPELPAKPLPDLTSIPAVPAEPVPVGEVYSMPAPPPTLEQARAEFAALKTYCETDSLGSAAEIYARMPDFGEDEEMNRLRADAANLLILGLARGGNLPAARRVYDSVPPEMPGFDARLAKARAVINLTTYYIRAGQYNDAFAVLMDVGNIQNRSALNNELFRLMARMIPYLDNAEETDRARRIYDLLLSEVKSPGTAALFAENIRASVLTYYFHYVDNSDSPVHRRKRLDFLEHIFISLDSLANNTDVRALKRTLGNGLAERYAGDPDRAALFRVDL